MRKHKIIAVEVPFILDFDMLRPAGACIAFENKIYLYSRYGELYDEQSYKTYIDTVSYTVKENKYMWCDFQIDHGQLISIDNYYGIYANGKEISPFSRLPKSCCRISNKSLKMFNNFLRETNKNKPQTSKSLKDSLVEGYFRQEVDEIIRNDSSTTLLEIDKELITRVRLEGANYIESYVNTLLFSSHPQKLIDINYFFRRLFILEKQGYLELDNTFMED